MKIALFGATGFTGRAVLDAAAARGFEVTALARDPARLPALEGVRALQGDALNPGDVARTLEGVDAVVHCLGVGGKGDGKPTTLVSDSVRILTETMPEHGVSRLVCMSNIGAGGSGPWFANAIVFPLFLRWLRPLIDDKDRMEHMLADTNLDWVSVRLPNIIEGAPKPTRVTADGTKLSWNITTGSTARFLLDLACAERIDLRTPSVSN